MTGAIAILASNSASTGQVSISNQAIIASGTTSQTAAYQANLSGAIRGGENGVYSSLETWLRSGAASDYEIRATLLSGDAVESGTMNTWQGLGTTREWSQDAKLYDTEYYSILTIEIRLAASPFTVLDTATVSLTASKY